MTNSINKVRAASLILDAICKELGTDAATFRDRFDQYSNPVVVVIDAYEHLGFREKKILGMRLGFAFRFRNTDDYSEIKKKPYKDCALAIGLISDRSASVIFKRGMYNITAAIMSVVTEQESDINN